MAKSPPRGPGPVRGFFLLKGCFLWCHLILIIQTGNLVAPERMGLELVVGKSLCPDCGLAVFAFRIVSAGVKVKDPGVAKVVFGDWEPLADTADVCYKDFSEKVIKCGNLWNWKSLKHCCDFAHIMRVIMCIHVWALPNALLMYLLKRWLYLLPRNNILCSKTGFFCELPPLISLKCLIKETSPNRLLLLSANQLH